MHTKIIGLDRQKNPLFFKYSGRLRLSALVVLSSVALTAVRCDLSHQTVFIQFNSSNGMVYGMYDVYNNAFTHGGKTNITFDRYFIVPNDSRQFFTSSALQKRSKYGNRNKMADITMRIAAVVSHVMKKFICFFVVLNIMSNTFLASQS